MRRLALLLTAPLAACSPEAPQGLANGQWAGPGRDRLCIAGEAPAQRGGFVVYGRGNANCSAAGAIAQGESGWQLVPAGEPANGCRFALRRDGAGFRLGPGQGDCAYYCGPGATLGEGRVFSAPATTPAADLAGDPLC